MGVIDLVKYLVADRKIRRLLRTAPNRALADVADDAFVRVTGTVEPLDSRVLEAPLSGRICAYYSLVVLEPMRHGSLRRLREVATEQSAIPFLLKAGALRAVIDPAHARVSSGFDYKDARKLTECTDRQRDVLARHDLQFRFSLVGKPATFREAILAIDEPIVVFGAGTSEPQIPIGSDRGYRDGPPTRLRFTGTSRYPLVISDDPRSVGV